MPQHLLEQLTNRSKINLRQLGGDDICPISREPITGLIQGGDAVLVLLPCSPNEVKKDCSIYSKVWLEAWLRSQDSAVMLRDPASQVGLSCILPKKSMDFFSRGRLYLSLQMEKSPDFLPVFMLFLYQVAATIYLCITREPLLSDAIVIQYMFYSSLGFLAIDAVCNDGVITKRMQSVLWNREVHLDGMVQTWLEKNTLPVTEDILGLNQDIDGLATAEEDEPVGGKLKLA